MMAVSGLRNSWLIMATKAACARSACRAASRAAMIALISLVDPQTPSNPPSAVKKAAALACIQQHEPWSRRIDIGTCVNCDCARNRRIAPTPLSSGS